VAIKHQKANGQVERAIQTIKRMLVKLCNNRPKGWMDKLAMVRSSFNCAMSETTGVSPYFALMGFEPRTDVEAKIENEAHSSKQRRLNIARHTEVAKIRQERSYNRDAVDKRFAVDDFVLVKVDRKTMFDPEFVGPFPIIAEAGFNSYEVLVDGKKRIINADRLIISPVKKLAMPNKERDDLSGRSNREGGIEGPVSIPSPKGVHTKMIDSKSVREEGLDRPAAISSPALGLKKSVDMDSTGVTQSPVSNVKEMVKGDNNVEEKDYKAKDLVGKRITAYWNNKRWYRFNMTMKASLPQEEKRGEDTVKTPVKAKKVVHKNVDKPKLVISKAKMKNVKHKVEASSDSTEDDDQSSSDES
jgi:hypothetical protein